MRQKIWSIGYEGTSLETFLETLKAHGIQVLLDVRKNPVSRRKGFSKWKLAAALLENGIQYEPAPELGVPREWRQKNKDDQLSRAQMFALYRRWVLPAQTDRTKQLALRARKEKMAVLCFEREACDCHRSDFLKDLQSIDPRFQIVHLDPQSHGQNVSSTKHQPQIFR